MNARAVTAVLLSVSLPACGSSDSTSASSTAATAAPSAVSSARASSTAAEATVGVPELRDFKIFPEGPVKGHHFIAEIAVPKGTVVKDPMFRVVFKEANGNAVDTGSCAYRGVIKPDDHVPCYGAIWKVPKWAKYDITYVPPADAVPADSASLEVTDKTLIANKNEVDGKVTNTGKTALKNVNAYVSFYGSDGKIVGGNSAPTSPPDLEPGASGKFEVIADDVAAPPKTFTVKMSP
jgi:hypothetical protein